MQELITYLKGFVSPRRLHRFDDVLSERTGHLRVVLEDLYQGHNASAVLRSCDCFGVHYVHFIENKNRMKLSADVDMGAGNWLHIQRHHSEEDNTRACLRSLKAQGYRIVATTPHERDKELKDIQVDSKLALVFGTEVHGISQAVYDEADEFVKIPMYGFTESFNISVCAAICMYELSTRIRRDVSDYKLSPAEYEEAYLSFLKNSIPKSELILKEYYHNRPSV